jgi:hypothetical protein
VFIACLIIFTSLMTKAQSYAAWYQNAQQRIDTLRKNDYGLQIFHKDGQPYTGEVLFAWTDTNSRLGYLSIYIRVSPLWVTV